MKDFKFIKTKFLFPFVLEIKMSRPDVFNAFNDVMVSELTMAFSEANVDNNVRVIVLSAEGKHFSAGADINWMKYASTASYDWNLKDARKVAEMFFQIEKSNKPTVARVQGSVFAGGIGLICVCDVAVASENSKFEVSEAKIGLIPSTIAPYLINAVGKKNAKYLSLTTSRISAMEAIQIGLVQNVVADDYLDAAIESTSKKLLKSGPNSIVEIKSLFAKIDIGDVNENTRELTAKTISRIRASEEAKEGFEAFFNKRKAKWLNNP